MRLFEVRRGRLPNVAADSGPRGLSYSWPSRPAPLFGNLLTTETDGVGRFA